MDDKPVVESSEDRAQRRDEAAKAAAEAREAYDSPPDSKGPQDVPAADGGPDGARRLEKQMEAAGLVRNKSGDGYTVAEPDEDDDKRTAAEERKAAGTKATAAPVGRSPVPKSTT